MRTVTVGDRDYLLEALRIGPRFIELLLEHGVGQEVSDPVDAQWFYGAVTQRTQGRRLPMNYEWCVEATINEFHVAATTLLERTKGDDRRVARRNVGYAERLAAAKSRLAAFKVGFQQAGGRDLSIHEAFMSSDQDRITPLQAQQRGNYAAGWLVPTRVTRPHYRTNLVVWSFVASGQRDPIRMTLESQGPHRVMSAR